MTVVIQEVTQHGKRRWVRVKCPECGRDDILISTLLTEENKQEVECPECKAKFIVAWDESDEAMT